ncbi:methyltransferase domain-containing protein [Tenacibaculum finnmarkense genomovar finnmarkense]|uniref:RsmB/NOP family class I SAM-dependent RNA methyltransferase n=1 Tax=Tenacibaculum finnmarkense TaxID=2781243 RepID=UPI00187B44ED|nr:methyltransferase domain-containing protein [Tenacibaculum finnmarkense]MBE7661330.1 methyltransferase domain-containing protein [Tenacibaculum finnmarkense genomovar finnmarkense]MCD8416896.1 methyltransferase domain-containing protein [Tenacibaculum finnmarkense genomovar finnmarkense]MCG8185465.1 methyltransferase domain-containing protein [Tenacibaculum finnmarkense genomovar finnmarkense]MCG8201849.1 methyltransferase domain-containing protein [Tenacibaculum finnmarkense genomovar finnm
MRLHRNLVYAVIDSLRDVFNDDVYADKAVEKALKRDKRWGARDRKFVAETIYDIVRWKRLYAEIADVKTPYSRPDLWRLLVVWCTLRGIKLPDWNQIEETPTRRIKGKFDELSQIRKYRESIPDWIDELGVKELGETVWTKEMAALNKRADVILRTNTLNVTKEHLQKDLQQEGIETEFIEGCDDALRLVERANVFKTEAFHKGFFEVQDASSQLVAAYLDVAPGMRVIDTCAGAGGKTLHLAALMKNKGQIIAMDIYESKLRKLKVRARRNGISNIDLKVIDSTKVIKKLYGKADRVLIDAPCSGLGVLRRNPDSKWKLQPEFIDNIKEIQQDVLQRYSRMVKPGGKLVYATCSVLPSENQDQVKIFLASEDGKDFSLVKDHKVLAHEFGYDGFYMAQLVKK